MISDAVRADAEGHFSRPALLEMLGTDDFGTILALLREHGLALPRAPKAGRERHLAALKDAIDGRAEKPPELGSPRRNEAT